MACARYAAFDVETTGLSRHSATSGIFAYCITWPNGFTEVYRMDTDDASVNERGWARLRRFMADGRVAKICHNYKMEKGFLDKHKIAYPAETIWHDTMLMSRIQRNLAPSHALDYFPWEFIGYRRDLDKKVSLQARARGRRWDRVDKPLMYEYQICDGERTMLLYLTWIDEFKNNEKLYREYLVELELVKTTLDFEDFGIRVERVETESLIKWLKNELDKTQSETYTLLGSYANLNSDRQVIQLLYKRFEYPIRKLTKHRQPSTGKEVLLSLREDFDNPLFDLILKTRSYTNGLAMLEGYLDKSDSHGIIYPTINTCQARTARQSGENPNLQNVSKEESLKNLYPVPARRCFCTHPGTVFCFGDYAAIEMRLIIDAAKCETMMSVLARGESPHDIACRLFYPLLHDEHGIYVKGYRDKKQDKIYYDAGKAGHFALGYGAGPDKIGKVLLLTPEEARAAWDRYAEAFPEIAYLNKTIAKIIRQQGYIVTPFGRKLFVPISKSYAGLNYLIQCTAAMILKRGEIAVDEYLKRYWKGLAKIVLPIHDELIIAISRKVLSRRDEILWHCGKLMTDMPEIDVALDVEWKESPSTWNRAKGINLCYKG